MVHVQSALMACTKTDLMQCALTQCHKVCISCVASLVPTLLDSSSEVTLITQSYFNEHLLPIVNSPTEEKS